MRLFSFSEVDKIMCVITRQYLKVFFYRIPVVQLSQFWAQKIITSWIINHSSTNQDFRSLLKNQHSSTTAFQKILCRNSILNSIILFQIYFTLRKRIPCCFNQKNLIETEKSQNFLKRYLVLKIFVNRISLSQLNFPSV